MARKIYAVFYLKYISNPFSVKIWCKTGFPSPDAYVYTQVWVTKSRIVPKIYAVFYLKYISNPFSVKIWCKTGFPSPDAYYGAQDLRRNLLFYISYPFSVKIWCKTGFRKPRHVLRYVSLGEQKPHRAEDLRCILFEVYIKPV